MSQPTSFAKVLLRSTMKAWRFHKATGGAEKHMRLEHIPLPPSFASLPANSTIVKVLLVSLNQVDIKFAETPFVGRFMHPMPATPGCDGVGRVVKTTDASKHVGQLVAFRMAEKQTEGALAEYVMVPSEGCASVPENVSPTQAATVGTCGVTACQALAQLEKSNLPEKPPRVFVNGGSGGTGTFQIQIAKAMGWYVVTSCSTPNVELCKKLGADEVLDYRKGPVEIALTQMVQRDRTLAFDLVVDNVDLPWRLYKAADEYLKPDGTYVQVGGDISLKSVGELIWINALPAMFGGGKRRWTFMAMKRSREDAERVLAWMAQGKVRAPIDEEFSFDRVPGAYEKLKAGRTKGKIIVRVADDVDV